MSVMPGRPRPASLDGADAPPLPDVSACMGVKEALGLVAGHVAAASPDQVWVTGEVAQVKRSRAGHLYWTLVEDGAHLSCSALGADARRVLGTLASARVELTDGLALRIQGQLRIYVPRASVELRVSTVDPRTALGNHEMARRALRAALAAEGLAGKQAALTPYPTPLRVGVVAPDGAGLADLVGLLEASPWAWSIRTARVSTEGSAASGRIAAAIPAAAASADVVVIARGGGAAVGLPYDAELVARAVCACGVPVVAALGHTDDRTITDEVAWRSVATPSAAAALLCGLVEAADATIVDLSAAVARTVGERLEVAESALAELEGSIAKELAVARARAERPVLVVSSPAQMPPPPGDVARLRRIALACALVAVLAIVVIVIVVGLR